MRAISVIQPYADAIVDGEKTVECRTWRTAHRGDLVICSTERPEMPGALCGYAIGVVEVVGVAPFDPRVHRRQGCLRGMAPNYEWAWLLQNPRRFLSPWPVHGRRTFFEIAVPVSTRDLFA